MTLFLDQLFLFTKFTSKVFLTKTFLSDFYGKTSHKYTLNSVTSLKMSKFYPK